MPPAPGYGSQRNSIPLPRPSKNVASTAHPCSRFACPKTVTRCSFPRMSGMRAPLLMYGKLRRTRGSAFLPSEPDSTGLLSLRQRKFWGDQGAKSDQLFINGLNVLTADISPRAVSAGSGVNMAVFTFDDEGDNVTDLDHEPHQPYVQG